MRFPSVTLDRWVQSFPLSLPGVVEGRPVDWAWGLWLQKRIPAQDLEPPVGLDVSALLLAGLTPFIPGVVC